MTDFSLFLLTPKLTINMEIDTIKNQIADRLTCDHKTWNNLLNNTQPENYTCDNWKAEIDPTDIFIDISNNFFSVNEGFFTSSIILNSNIADKNTSYNKAFTAEGKFVFETESSIRIEEVEIDIEIDIF